MKFNKNKPYQSGVSTLISGEQERRYFYSLMLRSRGIKGLVLQGFSDAILTRQGVYTFSLKIGF